ncbi:response regulator transcription factor [Pradoshia sp. D12]|uniref:response regulator n=1 Tax=Bacillaceae TaxID=186817 RepID=UPI00112B737C|nr:MULTISPECIES: response regulator transcription factor [Bacillaceae]QFK71071.1 response regulator transcription factor [Pradoshia sp. D12]TPF72863.1 response regulator transcription factor [Bacillus sp. D12]
MSKINILIGESQAIIRDGLFMILKDEHDFEMTGCAGDTDSLIKMMSEQKPDVILLDSNLPPNGGNEALAIIKNAYPSSQIIMLAADTNEDEIIDSIKKGTTGYILKNVETKHLLYSIRQCVNGHIVLPSIIQKNLIMYLQNEPSSPIPIKLEKQGINLNDREHDIIKLLSEGHTNEQIAHYLFLSNGTVKNYVSQLYRKFKVNNRSELMAYIYSLVN